MKILRKIKRELLVILSKLCLKSARNDYLGLDLKYPVIYGMGRGYVIPGEAWMGKCLQAFVKAKQGCVIDVGVNVGVYLVKLRAVSTEVAYYGFEPNPVCNYYTSELIRMNGFKNARVLPVALADAYGVQTLYANRLGDKSASLIYETKNLGELGYSSEIMTVPGDELIRILDIDKIAAIKIDVEGAELIVLKGLLETIEKYRPFMYVEVWTSFVDGQGSDNRKRITEIYQLIVSRNYSVLAVNAGNELGRLNSSDDFIEGNDPNYIFVPDELLDEFLKCVDSLENCDVRIRA